MSVTDVVFEQHSLRCEENSRLYDNHSFNNTATTVSATGIFPPKLRERSLKVRGSNDDTDEYDCWKCSSIICVKPRRPDEKCKVLELTFMDKDIMTLASTCHRRSAEYFSLCLLFVESKSRGV